MQTIKKVFDRIKKYIKLIYTEISELKTIRGKYVKDVLLIFVAVFAIFVLTTSVLSDMEKSAVKILYIGGERVGIIDSPKVYENAKDDAESELSDKFGVAYKFPSDSAYYIISAKENGDVLTKQNITEFLIDSALKQFSIGFGLYLDESLIAVGNSEEDVKAVVDETVELYKKLYAKIKSSDDIIVFSSKIKIERMIVPPTIIKTKDEIRTILGLDNMANLNEALLLSEENVDANLSFSIKDISLALPEIVSITSKDIAMELPSDNVYYIGGNVSEELYGNDSVESASMNFKSSAIEVLTEIIPCGEEIIYDKNLKKGKKILVSSGVYGIKQSTYDVLYSNGDELTRTLLSEEMIKEPVKKVYRMGTKIFENSDFEYVGPGDTEPGATGSFILPTSGKLTSTFADRDLFGRIEFHGAIDIANKYGTPVYASDGGTVILSEWFSSYGNCIIIDHGNGYKTLYAHLSSYSVKEGDIVGQGWQIGKTGRTGRVTGNHLHFEVMINDKKVDPLDYVN